MPFADYFIMMGIGGLFVILVSVAVACGKHEEKSYFNSISSRTDVREFLEHSPERPEPGALKIGGWITIAIGLILLAMGGAFWLWG